MQKERDYLVKKVFPELRRIAEARGIPFSWCDLRFGVASFKEEYIIRICLDNIDNSSPCFVGILGNQYGSIPSSLNKEQIKGLSCFDGTPSMIHKKLGYTEIEMRYFITKYSDNDSFDFYFFTGGDVLPEIEPCNKLVNKVRDVFLRFLSSRDSSKHKLLLWKQYITHNTSKKKLSVWNMNENISLSEDIIYQKLKKEIEQKYPIPQFPDYEINWNEQNCYYQNIISKTCVPIDWNINWNIKDIVNLYSPSANGKTFAAANQIKSAIDKDIACFFYFIGVSRNIDTPLTIWKNILYQICKYTTTDFQQYFPINDKQLIRSAIERCLGMIQNKVLIVIDGLGTNIMGTTEEKNTFLAYIPDINDKYKYLITSEKPLPESNRLFRSNLYISGQKKNVFKKRYAECSKTHCSTSSLSLIKNFHPADLNDIIYMVDELSICTDVEELQHINNSENLYSYISRRILNQINQSKAIFKDKDNSFFAGCLEAIKLISLVKYGLMEPDIYNICGINAEQWTIIYGYLSPFINNIHHIRINSKLAKKFISSSDIDDLRLRLINRLQASNVNHVYTQEVFYQLSQLRNKDLLCNNLADTHNLEYFYEKDKGIIAEYLSIIEKNKLIDYYTHILDKSLNNIGEIERFNLLCKLLHVYIEVFPRHLIAFHYLSHADSIIKKNIVDTAILLDYFGIKTLLYLHIDDKKRVLDTIQISESIIAQIKDIDSRGYYYKNILLLKVQLFDSSLHERDEKAALEIYLQLITEYQQILSTDELLNILNKYISLKKHGDDIKDFIALFDTQFNKLDIDSLLYCKYLPVKISHELYINKYNATDIKIDQILKSIFTALDKSLNLYPYHAENFDNFLCLIDNFAFRRVNRLKDANQYEMVRENIIMIESWIERWITFTLSIYGKDSIEYGLVLFEAARHFNDMSFYVLPSQKQIYLKKSLNNNIIAHDVWLKIYTEQNLRFACLLHNKSCVYDALHDFENALSSVNSAIRIKQNEGWFASNSEELRISIFLNQIKFSENSESLSTLYNKCKYYIDDLKHNVACYKNVTKERRSQLTSSIEIIEHKLDLYINNEAERNLSKASDDFEECKRIFKCIDATKKDQNYLKEEIFYLYHKYTVLQEFMSDKGITEEFCIRDPFFLTIKPIIEKIGRLSNDDKF